MISKNSISNLSIQKIIDNTDEVIFTLCARGNYTYVSRRWTKILGHDVKDVIGKNISSFVHPDDLQACYLKLKDIFEGVGKRGVIFRIYDTKNKLHWLKANGSIYIDKNSKETVFIGSATDITEYKLNEDIINKEKLKYQMLVENSNDMIFSATTAGVFTYLSPRCFEHIGYTNDELLGKAYTDFVHPDFHQVCHDYQLALINNEPIADYFEYKVRHKDGSWRWHLARGSYLKDSNGNPEQFIGTVIDITDKINQKDKDQNQIKILESIFERILAGFWDWDILAKKVYLSDRLKSVFGYSQHDKFDNNEIGFQQVMHPDDFEITWKNLVNYIKGDLKYPFSQKLRFIHKNGQVVTVICSGIVVEFEGDQPKRMIGCNVDISDVLDIKEKLNQQNSELLELKNIEQRITKDTAYKVIIGQEHERNRISQELHDGVNQLLFAAKIQLQESKTINDVMYKNGISLIEKTINEIKYIATNQNSFLLYDKSLYEALSELIYSIPDTKTKFDLKVNNKFQVKISSNKRILVLRIIQELIHNVLKYSQATLSRIFIKKTPKMVSILLTDNGLGFDTDHVKKGNGFINLENKLKIIEGNLIIRSTINKGTAVYVNFPINFNNE